RIVQKNQSIRSKLNSIITSSTYQKYLQDAIISLRGDRFVVPVKAEYRSNVSGIIHDQSSSGATLFIEPMSIVDMNNELRQLRLQEQEEIEKILAELSAVVGEIAHDIISNQEILGKLDFAFAKGKLSISMRAVEPELNEDKYINIKGGRHPLLDPNIVVANDIYLGRGFHTLLITGPNTGGKTVTIKTVGLFALMTQSGLHIPANFGSSMCIYDNIFADIGDEQSIEHSLSTFSSHMTNIVSILKDVTEDSLVIFDELGAGTDPEEGASLAIAILEDVKMAGAKCIATTHYSELKNYALTKEGVENAAVEFDVESLSPTYRLLMGIPGKSNAFEISKKLGLSEYIISRAKELIDDSKIELEDVLQEAEKGRLKAIEEKEKAQSLREEIERVKQEHDERLSKIISQKDKMIEQAKSEAFRITRGAKEEVDNIIKELRAMESEMASKEKNRKIEALRKELTNSMGALQPTVESMIIPKVATKEIKNLKSGDEVKVITLNQNGSVVSVDERKKEAVVQIGIMKMTLPFKSLQRAKADAKTTVTKQTRKIIKSKSGKVKSEVDLRGMTLEEAIMEVDKYLDDACVAGLEYVTIIHGIGTGVLKSGLQDVLKKNKHVKTQRPGEYGEGGAGVTIATLK
ncbi:MAG: endonuclease MutS2, partial [Peptostreptococcaceae bacterium]